jgi:hypothetical protein
MRLLDIAAPLVGFAVSAQALGTGTAVDSTVYTTVVVPTYTTVCPSPTTFAFHNITYTVTQPTTLTITNCPCTLTIHTPPPVTTTSTYIVPPPHNQTTTTTGFNNHTHTVTTSTFTYTPEPSTHLSGTTVITPTTNPTKTPIGPTATPTRTPPPVIVNSADKMALSVFGGLLVTVAAAMAFAL